MAAYAIVEASGKQFWIEEGRFYDFDKLPLTPGDLFKLNRVLLVNQHGSVHIGKPYLDSDSGFVIEATVVRHLSGSKVRVYKMRPKKKTRKTFGSRPKLTRVLVNSITNSSKATCYL